MKNSQSSVERFLSAAARVLALSSATAAASLSGSAFADETYAQNDNKTSDIALTGDTTFSLNYSTGRTATQSGVLSGAGHLFVNGSGTTANQKGGVLVFTAANTFTGNLTISNATLRLSGNNARIGDVSHIYSGVITLESPVAGTTATLDFNQTSALELRGKIGGEGNIIISGGASISFRNASGSTYSGTTTITNGILRAEAAYDNTFSANSSLVLNAANGATATVNLAGTTQTVAALTLANGTINGGSDGKLNVTGALVVTNGSINFGSNGELNARGGLSGNAAAGAINLGNGGKLNVTQTTNGTYAGTLSGDTATAFKKDGTATLTLSGNLAGYAGSIEIADGSLAIGRPAAFQSVNLSSDTSKLDISAATGTTTVRSLSGTHTASTINLGANTLQVGVAEVAPGAGSFAGVITGTGGFTKDGSGNFVLSGENTYRGKTTVAGGTLTIIGALGADSANTYNGVIALAEGSKLTLNQTGNQTLGGTNTLTGTGTFEKSGAGKLTLNGTNALTGANAFTGNFIVSGGTVSANKDANFGAGEVTINGATLELTGATYTKNVTVGLSGAVLDTNTVANVKFSGNILGPGTVTKIGTGTFEANGTISTPFALNAGTLGGTGTLGAVTFAPGTAIAPGTATTVGKLNLGNGANTTFSNLTFKTNVSGTGVSDLVNVNGSAIFNANNTLEVAGTWVNGKYTILQTSGPLSIGNLANVEIFHGGTVIDNINSRKKAILGNVALTDTETGAPTGGNALILTTYASTSLQLSWNGLAGVATDADWVVADKSTLATPQPNSWKEGTATGRWFQQGDIVFFGDAIAPSPAVQKTINVTTTGGGGVTDGVRVGSLTVTGTGYIFNGGRIQGSTASTLSPDFTADAKLTIAQGASATFNSTIEFAGGIVIAGEATVTGTVGTANTGLPLQIAPTGKLTVAGNASFHTSIANRVTSIENNGLLVFDRDAEHNYTASETITGTGSLEKLGAGVLTLAAANTYSGNTTITNGKLSIASDANLGTGLNTLDGGTLVLTGANNTAYSKSWDIGTNGGTIENARNVNFSPAVIVNTVTDPETGETTTTTTPDPTGPFGKLTGTGSFTKTGNGVLTLATGASYAGNTTITAGTLEIAGPLGTITGTDSSIYAGNIALNGGALTLNQKTDQTLSGNIIQGKDTDGNLFANATVSKVGTGKLAFTGSTTKREFAIFNNKLGETTVEGTFAATSIVNGTRDAREARSLDPVASFTANTVNTGTVTNHADALFTATTITATKIINAGTLRADTIKADVDNHANGDLYFGTQAVHSIEGSVNNAGNINFATGVPGQKITAGYRTSDTFYNSGAVHFNSTGQTLSVRNLSAPGNSYSQYYNYTLDLTNSANNNHIEVVGGTVTGWHEFHILAPENGLAGVDSNFTYELIDLKGGATIDPNAHIKTSQIYTGIYSLGVDGKGSATLRVLGFSPEGSSIFNAVGALSIGWFSQLDNLTQRQGELRTGLFAKETERDDDETSKAFEARRDKTARGKRELALWTRGYGFQANVDTGISGLSEFKEFQYGGDIGGDQLIDLNDDNKLFLGVFIGFQGSRRNIEDGAKTKNDTRSITGGAYGTWVNKNGWYADVSIKGQNFSTEYKTIFDTENTSFTTGGIGAAGELGKQLIIGERWFIEPSVQLAYSHLFNKAFRTKGNANQESLNVSLDGSDILRIAGGLRVGVNLALEEHGLIQPYLRIGVEYQTSDGGEVFVWRQSESRSGVSAVTPDLDGARVRGALGFSWQLSNAHSIHAEYETAYGDGYEIPWGINLGYRFRF